MKSLLPFFLAAVLTGCAGTDFTFDEARQVKVGMTESQLTEIMGRPYSIVSNGEAQTWVWSRANGFTGTSRAVSFILKDGVVNSVPTIPESFEGSRMQIAKPARPAPAVTTPSPSASPLTPQAYKDAQVQQLMQQNLPYEEYQKRYRAIMDH